jgi:hypothetical protein
MSYRSFRRIQERRRGVEAIAEKKNCDFPESNSHLIIVAMFATTIVVRAVATNN